MPPLCPLYSDFFVLEINLNKTKSQKKTQNEKKKSSCIIAVAVRADMFCFFGELSQINIMKIYSASVLHYFGFTRYIKKFK